MVGNNLRRRRHELLPVFLFRARAHAPRRGEARVEEYATGKLQHPQHVRQCIQNGLLHIKDTGFRRIGRLIRRISHSK
jgi:hypothetical protein